MSDVERAHAALVDAMEKAMRGVPTLRRSAEAALAAAREASVDVECPEPTCTGDSLDHRNDVGETPCPTPDPEDDAPLHCEHWYDGEACCRCGDAGLGPCPGGCAGGKVTRRALDVWLEGSPSPTTTGAAVVHDDQREE